MDMSDYLDVAEVEMIEDGSLNTCSRLTQTALEAIGQAVLTKIGLRGLGAIARDDYYRTLFVSGEDATEGEKARNEGVEAVEQYLANRAEQLHAEQFAGAIDQARDAEESAQVLGAAA